MDAAAPARSRLARVAPWVAAPLLLAALALAVLWWSLPDPSALAARNPPTTALIEQRRAEAGKAGRRWQPDQRWVALPRISRRLAEAVVASEDARFWGHGGFDWEALQGAARENLRQRRFARGASTITQQLAKNLWFGTEKSLLRKAREALQAARLERALGKRRILELYLNVAEWGDGVFGVEAAARRHLGAGAGELSTAQAVLLASMLPAPRRAGLAKPAPWLVARAMGLLARLHAERALGDDDYAVARAELASLLGLARPAAEAATADDEGAPLPEPPPDDAPEVGGGQAEPGSKPSAPSPAAGGPVTPPTGPVPSTNEPVPAPAEPAPSTDELAPPTSEKASAPAEPARN